MHADDPLGLAYGDLMMGRYDCVDRIVLNAAFPMGCSGGGFRTWWRNLTGGDETLDKMHLMRLAGRLARRVYGWAQKRNIPVIKCSAGERKHLIAEKYLPSDPKRTGVFLILVTRGPASVWDVNRFGNKGINLKRKQTYVNYYTFHIWDAEWGHVAIRMCGHAPFTSMIMLNGHEYVSALATKRKVDFVKEGNCFTELANAPGLQQVADTLRSQDAIGRLMQVGERWLYFCLCFALDSDDQKRTGFSYSVSVYQMEYSRNFLFNDGRVLEEMFQGLIDRTRTAFDIKRIKTILGCPRRPHPKRKDRWEVTLERPEYDLTIFKVHVGILTFKMYSKGERVLRSEMIVHNARKLKQKNRLMNWPRIVEYLKGLLDRFLEVVRCADSAALDDGTWDSLPEPSAVGAARVAGIDMASARMAAVMEGVVVLSTHPTGFTSGMLADVVRKRLGDSAGDYQTRQAAYDLKKLRGKSLVRRVEKSRRYEAPAEGLRTLVALGLVRDKVFKPVLRNAHLDSPPSQSDSPLDAHYANLREEMRRLFQTLNIAA